MSVDTSKRPANTLVIGTGMYVCGAGTPGLGTILPALLECVRGGKVGGITLVGTNPQKRAAVIEKVNMAKHVLGVDIPVEVEPLGPSPNPDAFRDLVARGDFDCALVSVPDHLHFRVLSETLAKGLHTLVVKPAVVTLLELEQLLALQRETEALCVVDFHKRFDESNLLARHDLRHGSLGKLLSVTVEFSQRISVPRDRFATWARNTNVFQYLGIHYVDLMYFLTGAKPVRALALGQVGRLAELECTAFDTIQALVEWSLPDGNGRVSQSIHTGWIDPETSPAMSDQSYRLFGSHGRIECDQMRRGYRRLLEGNGAEEVNPYFCQAVRSPGDSNRHFSGYGYRSIRRFIDDAAVTGSSSSTTAPEGNGLPTLEDSRTATAVVEAVNTSLESRGQWQEIELEGRFPEAGPQNTHE